MLFLRRAHNTEHPYAIINGLVAMPADSHLCFSTTHNYVLVQEIVNQSHSNYPFVLHTLSFTVDRLKDLNIGYHLPRRHRSSQGVKRKNIFLHSFIVASFNAQSVKGNDMAC